MIKLAIFEFHKFHPIHRHEYKGQKEEQHINLWGYLLRL